LLNYSWQQVLQQGTGKQSRSEARAWTFDSTLLQHCGLMKITIKLQADKRKNRKKRKLV